MHLNNTELLGNSIVGTAIVRFIVLLIILAFRICAARLRLGTATYKMTTEIVFSISSRTY